MKVFKKKNKEYSRLERGFTAFFAFIAFGLFGFIYRLFWGGPISLESSGMVIQVFLPYIICAGFAGGILGYFFPKPINILLIFLPTPGINS